MSSQLEAVQAQALVLSAEERALLAERLIASLFKGNDIEEGWAAEVERRIAEIEGGRVQLIPAADAIARARAAIKWRWASGEAHGRRPNRDDAETGAGPLGDESGAHAGGRLRARDRLNQGVNSSNGRD